MLYFLTVINTYTQWFYPHYYVDPRIIQLKFLRIGIEQTSSSIATPNQSLYTCTVHTVNLGGPAIRGLESEP